MKPEEKALAAMMKTMLVGTPEGPRRPERTEEIPDDGVYDEGDDEETESE